MSSQVEDPLMTADDLAKYVEVSRSMIMHENELVNHRMTWLLTAQVFLIAGATFLLDKERNLLGLVATILLAVVGIIITLSLGHALVAADAAIARLQEECGKQVSRHRDGGVLYNGPRWIGWGLKDFSRWRTYWFLPSRTLPWLFIAVWVAWVVMVAVSVIFAPHRP